ncbi:hypothetical protein J4E93_002176 [Alternaria ventricosa]|uniref:uncharacterized protein n=1 Tax=Alternaria ventricosa TaxID=1187951 RepID=UPI0020C47705|nr:uncharacterized protein J4E93_002176 [Alternaria ventricosa]KAI4651979.1 hypothetical protein J4E93_002176 [Alternaria ventricosa]
MFGCTFWIRDHRISTDTSKKTQHNGETKRDEKRVRMVHAEKLKEKCRLDRQGCVLFAMLAGGDYNEGGLPKCGADNALKAAQASLGRSLCSRQNQDECSKWGANTLSNFFKKTAPGITVPPNFPRYELLQFYNQPKIHSDDWLRGHARENVDYDHPLRETHLFLKACPPINMFWKKYFNHVGPILLSRMLAAWDEPLPGTAPCALTLVNTRQTAATDPSSHPALEMKVKFKAFDITKLDVRDLAAYVTQRDKPIPDISEALSHIVTYEMPAFLLRKVLPIPTPTVTKPSGAEDSLKRKHSTSGEQDTSSPVSSKKMRQPAKPATPATKPSNTFSGKSASSPMQSSTLVTPSKQSIQHSPLASTTSPATPVDLSGEVGLRRPQPRTPRQSPSERFALLLQSVKK